VAQSNAFRQAGADSVFVPFVGDRGTIEQLVQQIDAPSTSSAHPRAFTERACCSGRPRVTFGPLRCAPPSACCDAWRGVEGEGYLRTLEAYGIPFAELQKLFGDR